QKYGINDIPLILQDLQLNNEGTQLFHQNDPIFIGKRLFVNGQESPYLNVARGWIRLRILNASISRGYELRLDNDQDILVIAKDQGFLPEAKTVKSVFVGMGERVEILIDLNEGENISLIAGKKRDFFDKVSLFFDSDGQLFDNTVLEFRPEGLVSVFSGKPTLQSSNMAVLPTNIAKTREFHLDTTNAMINQKRFDPRRVDVYAKQGTVERWIISSSSPTGFRIQGAKFIIETVNDQATPLNELVWEDTLWINGKVQILVQFENLSSNTRPFIFGSSDLMQADKGSIGLIVVQ
ncbi:MAG TPA: cell division protein FtsQ, partial [Pasteurellaceae bacterium]|nr:cell division protein FtsQ [Pasteurellaceae bacterium]